MTDEAASVVLAELAARQPHVQGQSTRPRAPARAGRVSLPGGVRARARVRSGRRVRLPSLRPRTGGRGRSYRASVTVMGTLGQCPSVSARAARSVVPMLRPQRVLSATQSVT